jgi:hypothetical protein
MKRGMGNLIACDDSLAVTRLNTRYSPMERSLGKEGEPATYSPFVDV